MVKIPMSKMTMYKNNALTVFEEKQCKLIAEYYPHSAKDIEEVMRWARSFDRTVQVLKAIDEHNMALDAAVDELI